MNLDGILCQGVVDVVFHDLEKVILFPFVFWIEF